MVKDELKGAGGMVPFPVEFPLEALKIVKSALMGGDKSSLANAGWNIVGYGLGVYFPEPVLIGSAEAEHGLMGETEALDAAIAAGENGGSDLKGALPPIVWTTLISLGLRLIEKYLGK